MDIYCDDLVAKVLENESADAAAGRDNKRTKKQSGLATKPPPVAAASQSGGSSSRNDSLRRRKAIRKSRSKTSVVASVPSTPPPPSIPRPPRHVRSLSTPTASGLALAAAVVPSIEITEGMPSRCRNLNFMYHVMSRESPQIC